MPRGFIWDGTLTHIDRGVRFYGEPSPAAPTITFRNNTTGETIEVTDTPAARALAERKRLPRAQRREQEAGARRLMKKSRKALLRQP